MLKDLEDLRQSTANIETILKTEVLHNEYVLQTISSMLDCGIMILDRCGVIKLINVAASALLKVSEVDVLGKHALDVFPAIVEVLKEGRQWIDEMSGITLDLSVSYIPDPRDCYCGNSSNHPIDKASASTTVIILRDSKSGYLYNSPLTAEPFHTELLNRHPSAILYISPNGRLLKASKVAETMLNLSIRSITNTNISQVFGARSGQEILEKQVPFLCLQLRDGGRKVFVHKAPIQGDRSLIGFILTVHDPENTHDRNFLDMFVRSLLNLDSPAALISLPDDTTVVVNGPFLHTFGYDGSVIGCRCTFIELPDLSSCGKVWKGSLPVKYHSGVRREFASDITLLTKDVGAPPQYAVVTITSDQF
jgi:hypothetical protein